LEKPSVRLRKYSKQATQLLLDKAGGLVYLHKIFQHLSVGVAGKRRRAENLPALIRSGQNDLNQSIILQ
jgi:hypothetical protein